MVTRRVNFVCVKRLRWGLPLFRRQCAYTADNCSPGHVCLLIGPCWTLSSHWIDTRLAHLPHAYASCGGSVRRSNKRTDLSNDQPHIDNWWFWAIYQLSQQIDRLFAKRRAYRQHVAEWILSRYPLENSSPSAGWFCIAWVSRSGSV